VPVVVAAVDAVDDTCPMGVSGRHRDDFLPPSAHRGLPQWPDLRLALHVAGARPAGGRLAEARVDPDDRLAARADHPDLRAEVILPRNSHSDFLTERP
jgi:hypothetical protein